MVNYVTDRSLADRRRVSAGRSRLSIAIGMTVLTAWGALPCSGQEIAPTATLTLPPTVLPLPQSQTARTQAVAVRILESPSAAAAAPLGDSFALPPVEKPQPTSTTPINSTPTKAVAAMPVSAAPAIAAFMQAEDEPRPAATENSAGKVAAVAETPADASPPQSVPSGAVQPPVSPVKTPAQPQLVKPAPVVRVVARPASMVTPQADPPLFDHPVAVETGDGSIRIRVAQKDRSIEAADASAAPPPQAAGSAKPAAMSAGTPGSSVTDLAPRSASAATVSEYRREATAMPLVQRPLPLPVSEEAAEDLVAEGDMSEASIGEGFAAEDAAGRSESSALALELPPGGPASLVAPSVPPATLKPNARLTASTTSQSPSTPQPSSIESAAGLPTAVHEPPQEIGELSLTTRSADLQVAAPKKSSITHGRMPAAQAVALPTTDATASNIRLAVKSVASVPSLPAVPAATADSTAPRLRDLQPTAERSPAVAVAIYPLGESAGMTPENLPSDQDAAESSAPESMLALEMAEQIELAPQAEPKTVYPVAPSIDDFPVGNVIDGQPTNLVAGEATTLSFRRPVVAVGSTDASVCQAVVVSDSGIALLAQTAGTSQIEIVFDGGDRYRIDLSVVGKRAVATDEAATRIALAEQSVAQMFPGAGLTLEALPSGQLRVKGQAASETEAREIISLVRKMFLVPIEDQVRIRR